MKNWGINWGSRLTILIAAGFVLLASSCSRDREFDPNSKPAVKAPGKINESFEVTFGANSLRPDQAKVWIKKSALEKEFLLHAQIVGQTMVPQWNGLKSRVVAFRLRHGTLYLMEATQGHTVTNDLPQALLLAQFPVEQETDKALQFDFSAGMQQIFVASDWTGQDYAGTNYAPHFESIPVYMSYLEDAQINSRNQLVIRQIAQVPANDGTETVEVKYAISPYRPDPSFKPFKSRDMRTFGYFEVAPLLNTDGSTSVFASRFHPEKPIVFAISPNVPKEYRDAVKEGILYWNQALGANRVQVVDAPKGTFAPNYDFNLVQWINWDQAGFAYADAQMDPRTGEIRHAQVFLTSAFAFGGRFQAQRLLKRLEGGEIPAKRIFSLMNFTAQPLCFTERGEQLKASLRKALSAEDEATILKISQDMIRDVTAHEIGHTLGLRHNFAGSLGMSFKAADTRELIGRYLQSGKVDVDAIPSSSVMEYQDNYLSILTGARIAQGLPALPYDQQVMENLYKERSFETKDVPAYCGDGKEGLALDCLVFDVGHTPIEYAAYSYDEQMKELPYRFIEQHLMAKMDPFGEEADKKLEEANPSPTSYATRLLTGREGVWKSLGELMNLWQVRRLFDFVGPLNIAQIWGKEQALIQQSLTEFGGANKALPELPADFSQNIVATIESLLQAGIYDDGFLGKNGKSGLTLAEKNEIINRAKAFFPMVETEFAMMDVRLPFQIMVESPTGNAIPLKLADTDLAWDFSARIVAKAEHYLKAEVGASPVEYTTPEGLKKIVQVPQYAYPYAVRFHAAKLLNASLGRALDWGMSERAQLRRELSQSLDARIGSDWTAVNTIDVDRKLRMWLMESRNIDNVLSGNYFGAEPKL